MKDTQFILFNGTVTFVQGRANENDQGRSAENIAALAKMEELIRGVEGVYPSPIPDDEYYMTFSLTGDPVDVKKELINRGMEENRFAFTFHEHDGFPIVIHGLNDASMDDYFDDTCHSCATFMENSLFLDYYMERSHVVPDEAYVGSIKEKMVEAGMVENPALEEAWERHFNP